jgi:kynurenine formamidase
MGGRIQFIWISFQGMKSRTLIVGYVLALALFLFGQRHPTSPTPTGFHAVVDLTHSIDPQAYLLAGGSAGQVKAAARVKKEYLRNRSSTEPFETRIDAPAHFARGLWTVDQIPTERLIAPLVVLDVSANVENHPDYQISVEDIATWEQVHNQIPLGSVVIARTGWDSSWKSPKGYRNGASDTARFPGYSPDAAKFLVEGRNVLGLGIDTPNIDNGPSKDFAVRQYTLSHSVYQLENVANLDRVPAVSATVVVAPTKLESGASGPVRILALLQ